MTRAIPEYRLSTPPKDDCWQDPDIPAKVLAHAGNDSEAQYRLGLRYLRDGKLTANPRFAVHWLREAASRGHAKAEYLMAVLSRTGEGCAPSARQYVNFLRIAASHLQPQALCDLGSLYHDGVIVPKDLVRARQMWRQAHGLGNMEAVKKLAMLEGIAGTENFVWWQKAAKAGDAESLYMCAEDSLMGSGQMSPPQAMDMLKLAAQKRFPRALFLLGEMYRGAMKVPHLNSLVRRDCVKSARYLGLACSTLMDQQKESRILKESQDNKLLLFTKNTENQLFENLHISRILMRWQQHLRQKKKLLRRLVGRYTKRSSKQALVLWRRRVYEEVMRHREVAEAPFQCGRLLQRAFDEWRYMVSHQDYRASFGAHVLAKAQLRRVLCLWRCHTVRARTAFFVLEPLLQEQFVLRARAIFDIYKVYHRAERGVILLARLWRRRAFAGSFRQWSRNAMQLTFIDHKWAFKKQTEALQQGLREHRLRARGLESKVSMCQQRLSREHELNKTLEKISAKGASRGEFAAFMPLDREVKRSISPKNNRIDCRLEMPPTLSNAKLHFGQRRIATAAQRLHLACSNDTSAASETSSTFMSSLDEALERGFQ
eukprot:GEMP01007516.1.p1 GENE.GEMP01007516.1~~GEMP01007516.1.p1  ORF type:complete len:599 (+),score=128.23 GEMP01007516.1:248-2044(+)